MKRREREARIVIVVSLPIKDPGAASFPKRDALAVKYFIGNCFTFELLEASSSKSSVSES